MLGWVQAAVDSLPTVRVEDLALRGIMSEWREGAKHGRGSHMPVCLND